MKIIKTTEGLPPITIEFLHQEAVLLKKILGVFSRGTLSEHIGEGYTEEYGETSDLLYDLFEDSGVGE